MTLKAVVAGLGGRGVLFTTRLIAEAAREKNHPVLASETHGMSQRGGSVVSYLKIGPASSPMMRMGTADLLLGLERIEALKYLPFLKVKGWAVINTSERAIGDRELAGALERRQISLRLVDGDGEALMIGSPVSANMVLLGYLSTLPIPYIEEMDLYRAVKSLSPPSRLESNLRAFERGIELARNDRGVIWKESW